MSDWLPHYYTIQNTIYQILNTLFSCRMFQNGGNHSYIKSTCLKHFFDIEQKQQFARNDLTLWYLTLEDVAEAVTAFHEKLILRLGCTREREGLLVERARSTRRCIAARITQHCPQRRDGHVLTSGHPRRPTGGQAHTATPRGSN